MESLRHDIDHAKRRGRNSVIKLVLGSPRMKARSAEIRGNLLSPWIPLRSIQTTYLRGLFLGQYN